MRVNRQLTFLFVAFAFLCIFLYAVSDILLPFVLGILVAYLLDPIVDRIEKRRIHRGIASAFILIIFFGAVIALGVVLIPVMFEQVEGFVAKMPQYINQFNREVLPMIRREVSHISPSLSQQINETAHQIPENIGAMLSISLAKIFASGLWFINLMSLILITPIVSFYLLRDWDISLANLYKLLPQNYAPIIKKQAKKIDDTISAFLRGQLTICLLLGFFYAIFLSLFGLNFGFLIGLGTGLLTFIPYVGLFVGAFTGMMIAFLQFGDDMASIIAIAGVFITGQIIEGNFITPKIMGSRIGVHPAWLIFGMLAGGSLLGFLGVIISVPMTAIVAVLLRFAIEQYENSSYYLRNRNTDVLEQPTVYTPAQNKDITPVIPKSRVRKKRAPRQRRSAKK